MFLRLNVVTSETLEFAISEFDCMANNWSYYLLLKGVDFNRFDIKGLINLIDSLEDDIEVRLFLCDEFNPIHDFIKSKFEERNNLKISFPEKMPIDINIGSASISYARRIFPYPGRKIDVDKAKLALGHIAGVLNSIGIDWHVSFGTLLGLAREGSLIPWDCDLDVVIGAHEKDFLFNRLDIFEKNDIEISRILPHILTIRAFDTPLDIYYYTLALDKNSLSIGNKIYSSSGIELPTAGFEFDGIGEVRIPLDFESVLSNLYGLDWRTPDPTFFWKDGELFGEQITDSS